LKSLPPSERAALSLSAADRLVKQQAWQNARAILFYSPSPQELDLSPLLVRARTEGRLAALPRFAPEQQLYVPVPIQDPDCLLQPGQFGILEPPFHWPALPPNQLDLILVPGIAFDLDGQRLGRGRGFYDRLLTHVRSTKCGVAFDFQVEPKVPSEPHDVRVDFLLTPTRWFRFDPDSVLK
jgi:5-formyltetrahydrofolate cyclo-ligase